MKPYYEDAGITLYHGDAIACLQALPAASVQAVVSDPPYPEIDRPYGRLTEAAWMELMQAVVRETRRVLTPEGSAVFILQPNSERIGRMRGWLWRFMAWCVEEWNVVQDAYWWNHAAMPAVGCARDVGLMRPSVKPCVWVGPISCYRNQDAVLWTESQACAMERTTQRAGRAVFPSGHSVDSLRINAVSAERGGVTPYNLLPIANTNSTSSAGANGHGAGTPLPLCSWWIRYLTRPGDTVLDMFGGSGTVAEAARRLGRKAALIEKEAAYCEMCVGRFANGRLAQEVLSL